MIINRRKRRSGAERRRRRLHAVLNRLAVDAMLMAASAACFFVGCYVSLHRRSKRVVTTIQRKLCLSLGQQLLQQRHLWIGRSWCFFCIILTNKQTPINTNTVIINIITIMFCIGEGFLLKNVL